MKKLSHSESAINSFVNHHGEINKETICKFLGCDDSTYYRIIGQYLSGRQNLFSFTKEEIDYLRKAMENFDHPMAEAIKRKIGEIK